MTILVAYGEISLKGRYVRRRLEKALCDQISFALHRKGYTGFRVQRRFGRIYIRGIPKKAASLVANVFGVVSVMPAEETDSSFKSILSLIVETSKNKIKEGGKFAIRSKVIGKDEYSSRDVAVEGGSAVLEALSNRGISVDLDNPDVSLNVEVRDKDGFVYTCIIDGVGGLPYGTQGCMVSLFSGGIDSPVATWLMMKRGVEAIPLFMDQRPYVGENYVKRAKTTIKVLREYAPNENYYLYFAPMNQVMRRILDSSKTSLRCILCKRAMYRIAESFAEKKHLMGIVTGESLGQVASQTLMNIYVIDRSVSIPVIRPLVGLDKVEIEHIAQEIGTYELTARTVDECKIVPEKPAINSEIEEILELEEELDLVNMCKESADRIYKEKIN